MFCTGDGTAVADAERAATVAQTRAYSQTDTPRLQYDALRNANHNLLVCSQARAALSKRPSVQRV